ncbi:MAG: twin-arginine translocase TatA/TatE family subunit [Bacteroidia bacterium]
MLLFMGLSFGEILVIVLFILLFFGADSIPKIARGMGRAMRQIKDATQEVQDEIKKSANISDDIKKTTSPFTDEIKKIENDIKKNLQE